MLAKTRFVLAFVALVALSGCATQGVSGFSGYQSYRTPSPSSGGVPSYSPVRTGPLGMSGTDAATIGGAVAGGALGSVFGGRRHSEATTVLGAVAGAFAGWLLGSRHDAERAAIGVTNCGWRSQGRTNPDGTPSFQGGDWGCSGGNSVPGNRHVPPVARPQ